MSPAAPRLSPVQLAHLDGADSERLLRYLAPRDVSAGECVVRQGDEAGAMYFVASGVARLERYGMALGQLHEGECFGELGLFTGRKRAASVRAVTDMRLWVLDETSWAALNRDEPAVAARLLLGVVDGLGHQLVSMTDTANVAADERSRGARDMVQVQHVEGGEVRTGQAVRRGTKVSALLPPVHLGATVVGALLDNRPVGLDARVRTHVKLEPLTVASQEGRQVFRRSADLLLLASARSLYPDRRLEIGGSIGPARVVRVAGDASGMVSALNEDMARRVREAAPFLQETWSVDQARAWLQANGHADAVAALKSFRGHVLEIAGMGEFLLPSHTPVLPSAGLLEGVRVSPHPQGLLLDYGPVLGRFIAGPAVEAWVQHEREAPRFGGEMVKSHGAWLGSLGIDSVGAFNASCLHEGLKDLVRVAEGFHEKRVGQIADAVAARRGEVRIIAIAGPSSSGKTTFIQRLTVQLEVNGIHPVMLGLDDYYVDRDRTPRDADGEFDFEALEALNLPLLHGHLSSLLAGDATTTSRYDFRAGKSHPAGGPVLALRDSDVLVVEGIHGLNPALVPPAVRSDQVFRVFVQPVTPLRFDAGESLNPSDVRLLRRVVRDRRMRGYSAADTIQRWPSVRRGEALHVFPTLRHADLAFDTGLVYEMGVLKVFAERYLLEVPEDHPSFPTALRLRGLLDRFVSISPDHVPPTSLLREFIGGSGFDY
jgi:uridine kinase